MGGVRTRAVSGGGPLSVPRSKFGCPAVPIRAIARPRLAEVLAQPEWRVALVTGGPATGKAVAVAQGFETLDPVAREWVTLDASDDRPERFWLTFVLALDRTVPGAFTQAAAAEADVHRLPPEFLDRLLTAWSAVEEPLVIVLDDIHHLQSPEITGDLGFVVEHLPARSRMLLTSRVDPHLPVSRWRGRGWLAKLGQRDLAFTLPETTELDLGCRRSGRGALRRIVGAERQRRSAPAAGGRPEVRDGDRAGPGHLSVSPAAGRDVALGVADAPPRRSARAKLPGRRDA